MKAWRDISIGKKLIYSVLFITITASVLMAVFFNNRMKGNLENEIEQKLVIMTEGYANGFERNIKEVELIAQTLEEEFLERLDNREITVSTVNEILLELEPIIKVMAQNSNQGNTAYIYIDAETIGIPIDVYYADEDGDGKVERQQQVDASYFQAPDGEGIDKSWWFSPKDTRVPHWTVPYEWVFDNGEKAMFMSYTKPLIIEGNFIGVVGSDLLFDRVIDSLDEIDRSNRGVSFLINHQEQIFLQSGVEVIPQSVIDIQPNARMTASSLNKGVNVYRFAFEGRKMLSAMVGLSNGWYFGIAIFDDVMFKAFNDTVEVIIFMLIISAGMVGYAFYRVGNSITKPIIDLVDYVEQVDGEDYHPDTIVIEQSRKDEIGQLKTAVEEMVGKIHSNLRQIHQQNDMLKEGMLKNKAMKEKMNLAFDALSNARDGIVIVDRDLELIYNNEAFLDQFSIDKKQILKELKAIVPINLLLGETGVSKQWKLQRHVDGQVRNYKGTVHTIGETSDVFLINFRDITMDIHHKNQLEELQDKDLLTGLLNRVSFQRAVSLYLENEGEYHGVYAMMLINIDQFRRINDSVGFQRANRFLVKVATAMSDIFGDRCLLARTNGDEFGIFVKQSLKGEDVEALIRDWCDQIGNTYEVDGEKIYFTYSIGVSLVGVDANDASESMDNAHAALNHAKGNKGTVVSFFNKEILQMTIENYEMVKGLREAIDSKAFEIHYQPKWDIEKQSCVGLEALARWKWQGEYISPDVFIRVAEYNNLMLEIGEIIFEKALVFLKTLEQESIVVPVSVNVSAIQFSKGYFVAYIKRMIKRYEIRPEWLEIELTESILMNNREDASEIISKLQDMGIESSIDDFGKGYSSLSYLQNFGVNRLKIDRNFIMDIPDRDDGTIAKLIMNLSNSLKLDVVAEGVETEDQLNFLKSIGCETIQGYFIGKPMGSEEITQWLKAH